MVATRYFPPNGGGIGVFLSNLCAQFSRFGHRVDVLTPDRHGSPDRDDGQPYRIYSYKCPHRHSSVIPICRTLALHKQHWYDIVFIGHFITTHALGALVLRKLWGVPYVILVHGTELCAPNDPRTPMEKRVARMMLRNATLMLSNSRFTAERIRRKGYHGPVEVLNHGVAIGRFHPEINTALVRQKYNLVDNQTLLTVGRLEKSKKMSRVCYALCHR